VEMATITLPGQRHTDWQTSQWRCRASGGPRSKCGEMYGQRDRRRILCGGWRVSRLQKQDALTHVLPGNHGRMSVW